jgi:hypothetical protein
MSSPGTAGQSIPGRGHDRTAPPPPMPLACQPGPPRVVVDDINGRDALYEIDLTATPSSAWRVAFFHPPSHLTGPRSKPYVRRLYVHEVTVHFRTAPRYLGRWLRRIDRWIAYANSVMTVTSTESRREFGPTEVPRRLRREARAGAGGQGEAQTLYIGDPARLPS